MTPFAPFLLTAAVAGTPVAVEPVEWSSIAQEQPAADAGVRGWVREEVDKAGRAGEGTLALTAFVSSAECAARGGSSCEVAVRWKLVDVATGAARSACSPAALAPTSKPLRATPRCASSVELPSSLRPTPARARPPPLPKCAAAPPPLSRSPPG